MAYLVTYCGYFVNHPSLANLAVIAVGTGFLVARIHYEEALLIRYSDYVRYAHKTRWRLIPAVW